MAPIGMGCRGRRQPVAVFAAAACWLVAICALLVPPALAVVPGRDHRDSWQTSGAAAHTTSLQSLVESGIASPFLLTDYRNFTKIAIVPMKRPEFIYVAVPNHIIKVGLDRLEEEDNIEWSTKREPVVLRRCKLHGAVQELCPENNIFALQATTDFKLLVCGSVVGTPTCSLRSAMQPKNSFGSYNIQLRESDLLSEKVIAMEDKQVFVGAFLRHGRADPAIYRSSLAPSGDAIRTNQDTQQSRGMKSIYQPARFISVHIAGDYVYYFFQENFEEMSTCGAKSQRTVSRVARVCKTDPGYQRHWLSYSKSRLVCSEGGNWVKPRPDVLGDSGEPFYYDLLQDTFITDSHIYGLFTATRHGIRASAICGFPFSTFNSVFADPAVKVKRWETRDSGTPVSYFVDARDKYNRSDCKSLLMRREEIGEYERSNRHYFLKSRWVVQDTNEPVAAGPENWLRLLVDRLPSHRPGLWHTVAFVLTERHSIKKILLSEGNRCVLEEVTLDPQLDGKINDMKLLPGGQLILSTDSRLIRLPTSRCHRYPSRDACLAGRDPYCGWNQRTLSCTVRPANTDQWEQELSPSAGRVCPRTPAAAPVNGAWSAWSEWRSCHGDGAACMCRHRRCDSPAPSGGGRTCNVVDGAVQVTNCSRDGGWGEWTDWDRCSGGCATGGGRQTRSRRCDRPAPAHGGAACGTSGASKMAESQSRACVPAGCAGGSNDPASSGGDGAAAAAAAGGVWSGWSEWSECDRRCGVGRQERSRRCLRPGGGGGGAGAGCSGDSRERRQCNLKPCRSVATYATQSDWLKLGDRTPDGQTRWVTFGATCQLLDPGTASERLEVGITNRTKLCDSARTKCTMEAAAAPPAAQWGQWNCWSDCQPAAGQRGANCALGTQRRRRHCGEGLSASSGYLADAACSSSSSSSDSGVQERTCQLAACESYTEWSQWSPCQAATGLRTRTRACLATRQQSLPDCHAVANAGLTQTERCHSRRGGSGGGSSSVVDTAAAGAAAAPSETVTTSPPPLSPEASSGQTVLLSYPLVAAICIASVLASCLVSCAAVCCYHRRRLASSRRRVRDLEKELELLRSSPSAAASVVSPRNDLGRLEGLPGDASSVSDSFNNRSLLTSLNASYPESCFNRLAASSCGKAPLLGSSGGNGGGTPHYLRSASVTEPRVMHHHHHLQQQQQQQQKQPPPLPPGMCPTSDFNNYQDVYSGGFDVYSGGCGSSRGSFDAIRHLKPQHPFKPHQGQQQNNYHQHYHQQPQSPGPYSLDADEASATESNPLLVLRAGSGAAAAVPVSSTTLPGPRGRSGGSQRRVSCGSQTDSSSLRRPVRAATYASATVSSAHAVQRQQSEPMQPVITEFPTPL